MNPCNCVPQEIVGAYLAYVKQRGFMQCYIWACPPMKVYTSIYAPLTFLFPTLPSLTYSFTCS